MTVQDLIDLLATQDPDARVVIQGEMDYLQYDVLDVDNTQDSDTIVINPITC